MRRLALAAFLLPLAACATQPRFADAPPTVPPPPPFEVQILAINDFHGNLEVPSPVEITEADGRKVKVTTGGAAHLAAALAQARVGQAHSVTVSAGDTIGATPLTSALFLDEPTITAMNMIGLEFNAVGNHEFDKGVLELKRMQTGGCVVRVIPPGFQAKSLTSAVWTFGATSSIRTPYPGWSTPTASAAPFLSAATIGGENSKRRK